MVWIAILLFALAADAAGPQVTQSESLRASCSKSAREVTRVEAGTPVQVKFSIAGEGGECYKVQVMRDGAIHEGYLPSRAVSANREFEQARSISGTESAVETPATPPLPQKSAGPGNSSNALVQASRLLNSNQPAAALAILEQELAAHPGDANLLAWAGKAALESDRAQDAVRYLRQSLDASPNAVVERLVARAEREAKHDKSKQSLIGARFFFRYDSDAVTPDDARALLPLLDREYQRISERLGCATEERITAILQTPDAYYRSTGAAEWSGGFYDGRIRVALLEPSPNERTRRVLSHEIVHACLARLGDVPTWLHEGLAQRLAGEPLSPGDSAAVRKASEDGRLPPLSSMNGSWAGLSAGNARLAYTAAHLAARAMEERYGVDGLRNALRNPSLLMQISQELDQKLKE